MNYFYEKKERLCFELTIKVIISVILVGVLKWLFSVDGGHDMTLNEGIALALFFYGWITWIHVAACFFGNWLLGFIGSMVALFLLSFLTVVGNKPIKIFANTCLFVFFIGAFIVDIIRILLTFGKIHRLKKQYRHNTDKIKILHINEEKNNSTK